MIRTRKHLHEQFAEPAQLEMAQTAEQETTRQLISEASQKLSEAVQGKANNLQGAKVAQDMLSVGNEKLTACTKQLLLLVWHAPLGVRSAKRRHHTGCPD